MGDGIYLALVRAPSRYSLITRMSFVLASTVPLFVRTVMAPMLIPCVTLRDDIVDPPRVSWDSNLTPRFFLGPWHCFVHAGVVSV